jgi:diacylglycerol kinase family enzyme
LIDNVAHDSLPITVVLNLGSGHHDKVAVRETIESELAQSRREFRIVEVEKPVDLQSIARQLVEERRTKPQIIVACGGDGTINTVASAVVDSGLPLGVIPAGTFNNFARNVGVPLDLTDAVRALTNARLHTVHVARVNGRIFLNNSSFGLYRHLLEEREALKQHFGRYKAVVVLASLMTLWRHRRVYDVQMQIDGTTVAVRTLMVNFSLNTFQLEMLDLEVARCTALGLLAVVVLRPVSRLEMAGLAIRGALQGLRDAQNVQTYGASEVEIRLRGARRLKVAVDGEPIECDLPLRVTVQRNALHVLVPR